MEWLFSPQLLVLGVLVASAVAIQLRGRERMSLKRQVTDYSTFTAPFNVFLYAASAVPNRPYLDVAAFPELDVLRRNWEAIRDEAHALYAAGHIRADGRPRRRVRQLAVQEGLEAVLSQVVRRADGVGAPAVPDHRRPARRPARTCMPRCSAWSGRTAGSASTAIRSPPRCATTSA